MKSFQLLVVLAWSAIAEGADAPRPVYRIETVAGGAGVRDGGPAIAAQIGAIQGIALDRAGNLYLSDTDHHRVRRVAPNGTISTVAGTGEAGFGGDGGPGPSARLNLPYGLATDASGNLYIADLGNHRVRRVALDGTIATVAGSGVKGSAGDGGEATSAQLLAPRNLLVDASGNLYISEFEGHRVRRVGPDGKIGTAVGTGAAGYRGDGGPAGGAQLNYPAGLAMDRTGALYIADSANNRVRKVVPGSAISTVLAAADGLATPRAVAVDAGGALYVADGAGTVVYTYAPPAKRTQFAGGPVKDYSGDGGPAVKACLTNVLDLALDPFGNVYLADDVRVRKIDNLGAIQTVAGDGYRFALGDQGLATEAVLYRPSGVALDRVGDLWIADTGTNRVRLVVPSGTIQTAAGGLYSPMGVAADPRGNVFAADTYHHRIIRIGSDGRISTVAGTGEGGTGPEYLPPAETQLRGPRGICFDRAGTMFIADTANHRVLRAAMTALAEIAAGNGSPGDVGDGGPARLAQLNQPGGCAVDSGGNLFIADTESHRIRKVALDGTISTVAGTGKPGSSGDEGPATDARLNVPRGVAVDDGGNIYIADTGNHRIRQVTADGAIHAIAGAPGESPAAGFRGDGGSAADALLDSPASVFLDGSGVLYIADTNNNRIRRLVAGQAPVADPVTLAPLTAMNAASRKTGAVAPGEIVILSAEGIGPESGVGAAYDSAAMLPIVLRASEVRFDGASAPLLYAQSREIHAQVPYTAGGKSVTHVEVFYQANPVVSADLPVAASAPGLYPVAVNQDGSPNSSAQPAPPGTVLTFYATGEGLTDGPNISGQAAGAPYPRPVLAVRLTIGGVAADTEAFGAPGLVGMLQVNARVPDSVKSGPAVVTLAAGDAVAPNFTVWVK